MVSIKLKYSQVVISTSLLTNHVHLAGPGGNTSTSWVTSSLACQEKTSETVNLIFPCDFVPFN